jgi:hypothetical protein
LPQEDINSTAVHLQRFRRGILTNPILQSEFEIRFLFFNFTYSFQNPNDFADIGSNCWQISATYFAQSLWPLCEYYAKNACLFTIKRLQNKERDAKAQSLNECRGLQNL